jgi:4-hydroxybenzoate polyprenyltransferase
MRSAGCVVNDIADRNFDRYVERTKRRPLADGRLGLREAILVFIILCLAAFSLVLLLNRFTIILAFVGLFLAVIYPFIKRISHFPQVFLGIAFGWGAVMAWSAVRNSIGVEAILIFVANIFWSTAYDTVYAMMDIDDDKKIGVKSTAIFFGSHVYKAVIILHICFVAFLALAGLAGGLGLPFYFTLAVVFFILNYMVFRLKKSPTREMAFLVFVANCAIGAMILVGIVLSVRVG